MTVPSGFPNKWAWVIIAGYVLLSSLMLLHHEPWRDEAQAWLIARDCPDIGSIVRMTGYEGHPALWHLILLPLAKSGLPFFSASVVHFLIILTAVILFVRCAPFSPLQKALFAFGYYVFYEYSVIARNYGLSVLLLFTIASLWDQRFKRPIIHGLLLFLLASTNLHGMIIVIVLSMTYFLEARLSAGIAVTRRMVAAMLIVAAGLSLSIYQLWPPVDVLPPTAHQGGGASLFNLDLSLSHIAVIPHTLIGAFLPIPRPGLYFWNSKLVYCPIGAAYYFRNAPDPLGLAYVGLLVCPALLSLMFFVRKTVPLLFYVSSCGALVALFFLVYEAGVRHQGFLFILFIFSLWISSWYPDNRFAVPMVLKKWLDRGSLSILLTGFLMIQTAASVVAFYDELKYDFSSGKKVASFLDAGGLLNDDTFIATYTSNAACSILPYIEKPHSAFYQLEYGRKGSFMVWNREYMANRLLSISDIMDRVDSAIAGRSYDRVVLIINRKVINKRLYKRYELIAAFDKTVERDESFWIYQLKQPVADAAGM